MSKHDQVELGGLGRGATSSLHSRNGDADDPQTRMPIMSSSGGASYNTRGSSNYVERFSLLLTMFALAVLVIIMAIVSATNKDVKDRFNDLNSKLAASNGAALGLPGYESLTFSDVIAKGANGVVNIYLDPCCENEHNWITYTAKPMVLSKYGVTLNPVYTKSTAEIVQQVETDYAAGKTTGGGSVDIFWVNGANFLRAKTGVAITSAGWASSNSGYGNLLYGPWANKVPSAAAYDWNSAEIALDFTTPTDGYEMPFYSANFNLIYRTDKISAANVPKTFKDLIKLVNTPWSAVDLDGIQGNFNYWDPTDYISQAFIRHFLYEGCKTTLTGNGPFTAAQYDAATTCSNNYLQYLSSYDSTLYTAGVKNAFQQLRFLESGFSATTPTNTKNNFNQNTYCTSRDECMGFYKTGAVWMVMEYSATYAGTNCATDGTTVTGSADSNAWMGRTDGGTNICDNTKSLIPATSGAIANLNYMAIPKNAQNLLGAVAVGNWLGSIDAQFSRRYGLNADSANQAKTVSRWIGSFDSTKPTYTGANGGPSWETAYDYLTSYHNYQQTPDVKYLRPPYALPEINPKYGSQMATDFATCFPAVGTSYPTTSPCA